MFNELTISRAIHVIAKSKNKQKSGYGSYYKSKKRMPAGCSRLGKSYSRFQCFKNFSLFLLFFHKSYAGMFSSSFISSRKKKKKRKKYPEILTKGLAGYEY